MVLEGSGHPIIGSSGQQKQEQRTAEGGCATRESLMAKSQKPIAVFAERDMMFP